MISKNYHSVKQFTYFNDDRKRYERTGAVHPHISPQLSAWRRDFHHFAESGWVEFRTAAKVSEILDSLGYELAMGRDVVDAESRMGLPDDATLAQEFARARAQGAPEKWLAPFEGGFTGIVATLNTGRPGPTLAFRVDMDALDLSEAHDDSHRPYRDGFASCNPGMMHACAHDGHTTIGLGLAQVLKQHEAQLNGTIKLIFQPAEEGTRGARAMVAAGALDDVDYFTAIHIGTGVPEGTVICGSDNFMATTKFDVRFTGVAAHAGGKPEEGRNALLAAARPLSRCMASRPTAKARPGLTSESCRRAADATWFRLMRYLRLKPAAKARPLISMSSIARRR